MANTYGLNAIPQVSAVVTINATLTNPTDISLHLRSPDGTDATFTYLTAGITKDSVGRFHRDIVADQVGVWHYQWETSGTAAGGSLEYQFMVQESVFE